MDEVKRLELKCGVGARESVKRYAELRARSVAAYTAIALCGTAIAVFAAKGVSVETLKDACAKLVAYYAESGILATSAASLILPALCAVSAVYSGFCIFTPFVRVTLILALYGATYGFFAYVLINGGAVTVGIIFTVGYLLSLLALTLMFGEADLFRKNNFFANRRLSDIASPKTVLSYLGSFALPVCLMLSCHAAASALICLYTKYLI